MVITPETEIRLVRVPLTLDNKNQLTFNNLEEQLNYFLKLPTLILDNATYLRKDGVIRFDKKFDDVITYNYVMYKNKSYSNKWFFAFIINITYKANETTDIAIETDVFQTWQFDYIFKPSFVERDMLYVEDDVPGANLVPEALETGELVPNYSWQMGNMLDLIYVVAYAEDSFGHSYNGVFSGIQYLAYDDIGKLRGFLIQLQTTTPERLEWIISIFTVPRLAFNNISIPNNAIDSDILASPLELNDIPSRPTALSGYTPKNKKLLTYPYCYLTFNPSNNIYRFEDFANGKPLFNAYCEINPNPTVQIIPKNYHGFEDVMNINTASLTGFPTISWSVDVYNVWLAQNTNFINLKMENLKENQMFNQARNIGQVASGLGNAFSLDIGGAIEKSGNGALNYFQNEINYQYAIKEQTAQIEYHDLLPNKTNWGDKGTTLIGYNLYRKNLFSVMSIKSEFAQIIDNYFDMYGYQRNLVKVPNLNNRPNWNYVKTINANIIGNIPELDILSLKSLFDNGITLWHNPNTFLDYGQNNR